MTFKALLATKDDGRISTTLAQLEEKDLMPGDVTIAVDYSTVNYKDGVALTGRAAVMRKFPLIPGIDLAVSSAKIKLAAKQRFVRERIHDATHPRQALM